MCSAADLSFRFAQPILHFGKGDFWRKRVLHAETTCSFICKLTEAGHKLSLRYKLMVGRVIPSITQLEVSNR